MKLPRFLAVFLAAAAAMLTLAILKALLVSGLATLPAIKILIFAATCFGLVAAGIDWALLRDLLPFRKASDELYAPDPRLGKTEWRKQALEVPPGSAPSSRTALEESTKTLPGPALSDHVAVQKARVSPIVLREICPPPATGLSFYGGIPIGPEALAWPRTRNKPGNTPLSFVMQWDCAALATQDSTGLLPDNGALYLFCDLTWGEPFDFQFIHAPGLTEAWRALHAPEDLPPIFGDEGVHLVPYCSPRVEKRLHDVPRLLPKWHFDPTALPYPDSENDANTDHRFWNSGKTTAEALLRLEHPQELPPAQSPSSQSSPFARPFPAFPHDYAAVRIVAAKVLQRLRHPDPSLLRDKFEHERKTTLQRWGDGAAELYASAVSRSPAAALEQSSSDRIWRQIETMAPALETVWNSLVQECINTSLGIGSEASGMLPRNLVDDCAQRHALASYYRAEARAIHAPTPNRIFGPPSFVQGHVEEYLDDWVLLLELSSRKQIGHEFGEGVYQFMIRPAHLQERQFGRVRLVASAY